MKGNNISKSRFSQRKSLKESDRNNHAGMTQITSEEELRSCLDNHVPVHCISTGPFGEDEGAEVIYFGPIEKCKPSNIDVDSETLEEFGYENELEYISDFEGIEVVVLDTDIGQTDSNFFQLDGYGIEDLDLWVDDDEYSSILESSKKVKKLSNLKERTYEDYETACYQIKGMIGQLKKSFEDKTIRLALDSVTSEMLEESRNREELNIIDGYLTGETERDNFMKTLDDVSKDW